LIYRIHNLHSSEWPHPAVRHSVPGVNLSSIEGRQTRLTASLSFTGVTSFISAMSRLNVFGATHVYSQNMCRQYTEQKKKSWKQSSQAYAVSLLCRNQIKAP